MTDGALKNFIGQIDDFSFTQRLSILDAVVKSLRHSQNKDQPVSKADALYGFIKDSDVTLESARKERLSKI